MSDQPLYRKIMANETGAWSWPIRGLLRMAESAYGLGLNLRNGRYNRPGSQTFLPIPVISIGNITVGGTGKTPFVIDLIKRLEKMGFSPAVVSRGYKAVHGEPNDEELLIRQSCPSVVCVSNPNRIVAANIAHKQFGADIIVLDDGFQHRRLARTLDVVLIDATCPFGYDHLLPRGLLREPLTELQRANLIVLTRCDQVPQASLDLIEKKLRNIAPNTNVLQCNHRLIQIERLDGTLVTKSLSGKRTILFAGIGQPESFATTVSSLGIKVVGNHWWPDHYHYRTLDIYNLIKSDRFPPCDMLLTTQKDAVKLARLGGLDHIDIGVVKIDIDFVGECDTIWQSVLNQSLRPDNQT